MIRQLAQAVALTVSIVLGAALPHTEAETLSGKKIVLPDALNNHPTIVVMGFTKRSQSQTSAWTTQLTKDYANEPRLQRYSIAVLDGVPGFIRGRVIASMRRGVSSDQQDTFIVLTHDAKPWRDLAAITNADDAYVILFDSTAHVVAQTHGPVDDAYAPLQSEIRTLLNQ
jgi:ATP10 protein